MNKERLLELADHMECTPALATMELRGSGRSRRLLQHEPLAVLLRSPGLRTAGHAVALWGTMPIGDSRPDPSGTATRLLDLDPRTARRLFTPQIPSGLSCERGGSLLRRHHTEDCGVGDTRFGGDRQCCLATTCG